MQNESEIKKLHKKSSSNIAVARFRSALKSMSKFIRINRFKNEIDTEKVNQFLQTRLALKNEKKNRAKLAHVVKSLEKK